MNLKISKIGKKIRIKKIKASSGREDITDIIPFELLALLSLNNRKISIISCSPINLIELAVGYLINNDYIENYSDIQLIKFCSHNISRIINKEELSIKIEAVTEVKHDNNRDSERLRFIPPECGSIDDFILKKGLKKIKDNFKVAPDIILSLNRKTAASQKYKKEFGGLHCAALFDKSGNLLSIFEDIGRQNCIDKMAGYIPLKNLTPEDKILFTSGRLGINLIYKISRMKIPIIITNSSVTCSAVSLAGKINLTVIGYARGSRFNIYSSPGRILK